MFFLSAQAGPLKATVFQFIKPTFGFMDKGSLVKTF